MALCKTENSESDLSTSYASVGLQAIRMPTRRTLSRSLNIPVDILVKRGTAKGMPPDWQGLAELIGHFSLLDIKNFERKNDPTAMLLDEWALKDGSSVGKLLQYLGALGRKDVLDEVQVMIDRDVQRYLKRREKLYKQVAVKGVSQDDGVEKQDMIDIDDEPGSPAMYHGFLCVSDDSEDHKFALEVLDMLEGKYKLKMCLAARNLIAGGDLHEITAAAINERCRRMVIILSPEFIGSAACDFQMKFGHALSPGSRTKKLIPIMHRHLDTNLLPSLLRAVNILDFTKKSHTEWNWNRLAKTLETPLA